MSEEEYLRMYKEKLKSAIRKTRIMSWFSSFDSFYQTFERLDMELEKLEDKMFHDGISRDGLYSPEISKLRQKFVAISANRQEREGRYC